MLRYAGQSFLAIDASMSVEKCADRTEVMENDLLRRREKKIRLNPICISLRDDIETNKM